MTFYVRNKQTSKDMILKSIDVETGKVIVENNDGEETFEEEWRLVEIIEDYEFRYDIY